MKKILVFDKGGRKERQKLIEKKLAPRDFFQGLNNFKMKGYDIVGPWIAEKVRKHKFMTKLGIDLTKYYQDLMLGKKLSGKQRLIQLASHGLIRPIYRVIGAVAKLMERGKL
mgnify:CR=1 FL=1